MALDLSAIRAAAAKLQEQPKAKATKSTKATKHTDTPKVSGGAMYVVQKEFKQLVEDYLKTRPDVNTTKAGKSIDKCCEYIYKLMLNRAKKNRGGRMEVGIFGKDEELQSLIVHYYDESDDDLKKELKEGKE